MKDLRVFDAPRWFAIPNKPAANEQITFVLSSMNGETLRPRENI